MLDILLPRDDIGLRLTEIVSTPTAITLRIATAAPSAPCPIGQLAATRVHSHYPRTLLDLSLAARPVRLQLQVRRFFCRTVQCPRWVFTERLPGLAAPYAHRSTRLAQSLRQIGLALGGQAGARLAPRLQLPASRDTVLRLVRQTHEAPPTTAPPLLGMDDWAMRKGQTYGTILCDLQSGRVVDLLPDRESATVATWLEQHPGAEIISRDRAGAYAEAARLGAPAARQVADRFHVLCNLGEALEDLLSRLYQELCQSLAEPPAAAPVVTTTEPAAHRPDVPRPVEALSPPATQAAASAPVERPSCAAAGKSRQELRPRDNGLSHIRRSARLARYEEVVRLQTLGWSQVAIAAHLGLARKTIARWLRAGRFPERQAPGTRRGKLEGQKAYLQERWEQGCHNAKQLWRELRERGYRGGPTGVATYLAALRPVPGIIQRPGARRAPRRPVGKLARPRQLKWLLLRPVAELDEEEYAIVRQVCRHSAEVTLAYGLVMDFQDLMRSRKAEHLANWVELAVASGVAELASFARGGLRDFAAVYAGLELPWSQGAVEGNVNRLKMLKRQTYGRAKFDLLRIRVLEAY